MSVRTVNPPEGLPTGKGIYPALLLPFGEEVHRSHEDAGRTYSWGDVHLPGGDLPVLDGHDGEEVGTASHFVLTHDGIWAALKLGRRGEAVLDRGNGVSVEIRGDELVHVALVGSGTGGFASARVIFDDEPVSFAASPGLYVREGSVSIGPSHPTSARIMRPAIDLGAHRATMQANSMQAVHDDVEYRRLEFEKRQQELAEADVIEEQARLVAEGRPVSSWPAHLPLKQQYDEMEVRHRAEEVAAEGARAAREFAERMGGLEAAADRGSRRWWRWWK